MNVRKTFYDFNLSSLQERQERNNLFPELARFHIALREELSEEEYIAFFEGEKAAFNQIKLSVKQISSPCVHA